MARRPALGWHGEARRCSGGASALAGWRVIPGRLARQLSSIRGDADGGAARGEHTLTTWELVREDYETFNRTRGHPGMHAVVLYRLAAAAQSRRGVRRRWVRVLHKVAHRLVTGVYGIEIPPEARIGRRLYLPHPHGIVINESAIIGDDCLIRHNVTIGYGRNAGGGAPTIGDRVRFGSGSIVMGAVVIGDDVHIGPNAVVISDVAAGGRVLAPVATARPAKQG